MNNEKPNLDFCRQVDCTYKGERYSVRDNGEIFRHPFAGIRKRPLDNHWTFGKLNAEGYMEIASVRVHSIVATAFHGLKPTKDHQVDHIDTNRQNNRPENLRWVTKLENVLLNPITAKRIAFICGSVEAFLADPSKFRDKFQNPNYKWMCTVSSQEALISYERLLSWSKNDKRPSGGSLDKWIFNRSSLQNTHVKTIDTVPEVIKSKTSNAVQKKWHISSEFPCCPQELTGDPLQTYAEKLEKGSVFFRNEVYSSLVLKSGISESRELLYVISESTEGKKSSKPWALAKISFEDGSFVHTNLGNFFTRDGAEKQFLLAQGLEWSGGDSIDDYC